MLKNYVLTYIVHTYSMYYLLIVLYYLKTILKVLIFLSLLACMFSVAKPNFFVCLKMFSVGGIHKPCWQGGREGRRISKKSTSREGE